MAIASPPGCTARAIGLLLATTDRIQGGQRVNLEGRSCQLTRVTGELKGQFALRLKVQWHGQHMDETGRVPTRRTRQKQQGQKLRSAEGQLVRLRLIVSGASGAGGQVLA